MTVEEYFNQEEYYSESEQQFVDIDSLPWIRAYYSFRKLMEVWPEEFPGTHLYLKFYRRLCPSADELARQLNTFNEVSCMYKVWGDKHGLTRQQARKRLQYVGKKCGVKVTTHDAQWDSRGGNYIIAQVVAPDVIVRVNGKVVS